MFRRSFLCLLIMSSLVLSGCIIKGKIVDQNGIGVEGVTITLSGTASMSTATDSSGNYQLGTLDNMISEGNYTVTPSRCFTISGKSWAFTKCVQNRRNINNFIFTTAK